MVGVGPRPVLLKRCGPVLVPLGGRVSVPACRCRHPPGTLVSGHVMHASCAARVKAGVTLFAPVRL